MKNLVLIILSITGLIVQAQIPNNPLSLPNDDYAIKINHNGVYWTDSVEFSNGAIVRYTYDALGNRSTQVEVPAAPLAELRLLADQIPDTLGVGSDGSPLITWRNSGPIMASNFRLTPFLSTDSIYDAGDTPLDTTLYPNNFSPFFQEEVATRIHIPNTTTPNQYYWLFLHIDDNLLIQEYSDSNNIYMKKVFVVPCPALPALNPVVFPEVCNINNGRVSISLPSNHEIRWFNNSEDTLIKGLNGNQYYSYILTNTTNACSYTDSIFVDEFPALQVQTAHQNTTCNLSNGSATAIPISGYAPYTYSWSNGANTSDISGLTPGLYSVMVSDSTGCQDVFNIQIQAIPLPDAGIIGQNATCGEANGTAIASAIGGIPPYSYSWSNGDNSTTADSLQAFEIYTVTVTDSTGCNASEQIQLVNEGGVNASIAQTGNYIQANATGTPPFNYMWNNGLVTQGISVNTSGTYFVFVTDANNCTDSAGIVIEFDTITPPPTAIQDLNDNRNFYVYPNPNDGQSIMVHTNIEDVALFVVYDKGGKTVAQQNVVFNNTQEIELNATLSSGTYVLVAKSNNGKQLAATQFIVR